MTPERAEIAARWVLLAIVLGCWLRKTGLPCFTSERTFLFISGPHRLEMARGCWFVGGMGAWELSFINTNCEETQGLREAAFQCSRTLGEWQGSCQGSLWVPVLASEVPGLRVQLAEHPWGSQVVGVTFWRRWEQDQRVLCWKMLGIAKLKEEARAAVGVMRFLWATSKCQRGRKLSWDAD